MKRNIYLCGFMGCGKSTVGRALAAKLGAEFLDMDDRIAARAGMSVPEIFEKHGEAEFRRLETETARELSEKSGLVVGTGGGAAIRAENRALFKKSGVLVFVDVPPEVILRRLSGDASRPLLNTPDREKTLRALYDERLPVYRAADFTVANEKNVPAGEVAEALVKLLKTAAPEVLL